MKARHDFEDTKRVVMGRTPTKERQYEFEDTTGVIKGRTPKKNRQ
jgi:hypothetical protein